MSFILDVSEGFEFAVSRQFTCETINSHET